MFRYERIKSPYSKFDLWVSKDDVLLMENKSIIYPSHNKETRMDGTERYVFYVKFSIYVVILNRQTHKWELKQYVSKI